MAAGTIGPRYQFVTSLKDTDIEGVKTAKKPRDFPGDLGQVTARKGDMNVALGVGGNNRYTRDTLRRAGLRKPRHAAMLLRDHTYIRDGCAK